MCIVEECKYTERFCSDRRHDHFCSRCCRFRKERDRLCGCRQTQRVSISLCDIKHGINTGFYQKLINIINFCAIFALYIMTRTCRTIPKVTSHSKHRTHLHTIMNVNSRIWLLNLSPQGLSR